MTTIATTSSIQDVQRFRILLGSAGIEIFVPNENSAFLQPHLFFSDKGGIQIQVRDEDAELAAQLLREENEAGSE